MHKTKILLLLAFFLLVAGSVAQADILGDTVLIQYRYPDMNTPFGLSATGTVTAGGVSLNLFDNQLVTVFGNHVDMVGLHNSYFLTAGFNGVSIQDLTNPAAFTGFSVDPATTVLGFDFSRISISNGMLFINYEGLNTPMNSLARVDFTANKVPEPASLVLFGAGVLGLARKLKKKA